MDRDRFGWRVWSASGILEGMQAGPDRTETIEGTSVDTRDEVERPFRVICHDDPLTTMDFVVDVLTGVFRIPIARATEVMLRVHHAGSALVGVWPKPVAERRVNKAHALARANGFPLTLSIEEDD